MECREANGRVLRRGSLLDGAARTSPPHAGPAAGTAADQHVGRFLLSEGGPRTRSRSTARVVLAPQDRPPPPACSRFRRLDHYLPTSSAGHRKANEMRADVVLLRHAHAMW